VSAARAIGTVAAVLLVAGCGPSVTSGAGASCAGPQPALAPARAAVGQQITYTVDFLATGCRDTVPSDEVVRPLHGVPVEIVQGSGHAVVGTVSGSGERYTGSLSFAVPAWLRPGTADVVLHGPVPTRLPFTVVPGV
jgi:hypothetical protein